MGIVYIHSVYVLKPLVWFMINGRDKINLLEFGCSYMAILWNACNKRVCETSH